MPIEFDESLSILEHVYENEKKFADRVYFTQPFDGGQVKETTWSEMMQEARKMASYLKSLGFGKDDKIGMISKNCDKFIIAELAIWMAGCITVAVFPNTKAETVSYCLNDAEVKFLFVGKLDSYDAVAEGFPEDIPKVAFPLAPKKALETFNRWDDIIESVEPLTENPLRGREEIAMFIYTSGSTGKPKGVMHAFGPIADATHGFLHIHNHALHPSKSRVISYLPLAHAFERGQIEMCSLVAYIHIFFAESLATFNADMNRAKPTLFISVPRLWTKFQQKVLSKAQIRALLKVPLVRNPIRKAIVKKLGLNQVRKCGNGSAPMPVELLKWYRSLGLEFVEAYGMTEDFTYSHIDKVGDAKPGYVGYPLDGVKVKLDPETQEILLDSPGKFVGYWKLEEKTKEAFTEDGYFRTGDRGVQDSDGRLRITGRVKELFKTAKGKFISPAPIENMLNSDIVIESSLVSGVGKVAPYAQVLLAEDERKAMKNASASQKRNIAKELSNLLSNVNAMLDKHEQLKFLVVVKEEWTVESGALTPTMKIKRSAIEEASENKLDAWYEEEEKKGTKIIFEK